jgi:hypothetical protein
MQSFTYKLLSSLAIILIICSALGVGSGYLCVNEFNQLGCPIRFFMYDPLFGHAAGDGFGVAIMGFLFYIAVGVVGFVLIFTVSFTGKKNLQLHPRPKTLLLTSALILIALFGMIAYQRIYDNFVVPRLIEQNFEKVTGITHEQAQNKSCPGGLLGVALVRYPSCPECDKAESALEKISLGNRLQIYNLESQSELPHPYSEFSNLRDVLFARISTQYEFQKKRHIYSEPGSSFRADEKTSGVMVSSCGGDMLFDFTDKPFDISNIQKEITRGRSMN